jgi:histidine triad (HIT) family protein
MSSCLFCNIVLGTVPSHKVWESDTHLAFLSIFPNTEGVTVVIPKEHYPSYAFALPDDVLADLVLATKKVAGILDEKLPDVGRTAMVFEGFGVDHIHAKLFPMHGTADMSEWKPIELPTETYFNTYPGYISSHDAGRADDETLAMLAERLRS